MKRSPFWLLFLLATAGSVLTTLFFPSCHIHAFAPLLLLNYNRKPLIFCLYLSFFTGLVFDGISAEYTFGINALTYLATTFVLYSQRRNFFDDKASSLAIFTILFSALAALLQFFFLSILDSTSRISGKMLALDALVMPFVDALYAVVVFHFSLQAYTHIRRAILHAGYDQEID